MSTRRDQTLSFTVEFQDGILSSFSRLDILKECLGLIYPEAAELLEIFLHDGSYIKKKLLSLPSQPPAREAAIWEMADKKLITLHFVGKLRRRYFEINYKTIVEKLFE